MYRKNNHSLVKHLDFILLDILMLIAAYVLAYMIRFNFMREISADVFYIGKLFLMVVADLAAAVVVNSYHGILRRGYLIELGKVVLHVALVIAVLVTFSYATHNAVSISRLFIGIFSVLSVLFVYLERIAWKSRLVRHFPESRKRNLLLVGSQEALDKLLDTLYAEEVQSVRLCGVVVTDLVLLDDAEKVFRQLPVVAPFGEEAVEYISTTPLDGVVFADSQSDEMRELIKQCQVMGLTVHIVNRDGDILMGDVTAEVMGGVSVTSSCLKLVSSDELFWKRVVDVLGAAVGLIITGIALIFVAPILYISDPGPIFFKQKRIGEGGRVFNCMKIRSMYTDAEERKKDLMEKNQMTGYMFKMDNDPRIIGSGEDGTRKGIGWFIRTFSIDELPQFWNVMRGDMSLVGTRPPTLDEWEHYDPHHRVRMRVRPGITGLWQVSGRNEITDFEEVVKLDQEYITNWSLGLDIKILFKTVWVVIRRKGSK